MRILEILREPPELFNVVGRKGTWRIPRGGNSSTEACATAFTLLEPRFWPIGEGNGEHYGDLIMEGPLFDYEINDIRHGRFPPSLALFGRPAPGICGRPPAHGPAHGGMVRHPPGARVPHGELNHLGQVEFDPIEFPDDPVRFDESSDDSLHLVEDLHFNDDDFENNTRRRYGNRTPPTPPGLGFRGRRSPPPRQPRAPRQMQGPPPRQGRMAMPPNHRAGAYTAGISSASSSDIDLSDSDSPDPKKKKGKGKGKAPIKAKKAPKTKSAKEASYSADERPRSRRPPPPKAQARRRGRSDDEDDAPAPGLSRRPAPAPKGAGRRNRGRSPEEEEEDDDEVPPPIDAAEQAKLDALKAQNGYGKKGKDEKSGWH